MARRLLVGEDLQRVNRYLVWMISGYLLLRQLGDPVWALPATLLYNAYLLGLIAATFSLMERPEAKRGILIGLWIAAPVVLIGAAYVQSGWFFAHRLLLLIALGALSVTDLRPSHPRTRNALTAAAALTMGLVLTYSADRLVGIVNGGKQPGGLVFPNGSRISYQTPEFRHDVIINAYGFRGKAVDLSAPADCRIMLLGDSFTYGWGVDYEQTWGALLENHLHAAGLRAQVLNLGVPGGNVPDYAALAESAVPLLEPDVIVVGVLQGDDMRQQSREASLFPRTLTFGESVTPNPVTEYMSFHYPYLAERTLLRRTHAGAVRANWRNTAAQFRANYTPEQQARYQALDGELRAWFESGAINPHFVHLGVTAPDYWVWVLQDPATLAPYIEAMSADFRTIADTAPDAHTLIISVPHGAYTQPAARDDLLRLGFILPPEITASPLVDDAIHSAANGAGVRFLRVTDAFRTHDALAFYPVDGHFNAEGNRLLAAAITPAILGECAQDR